MLEKPALADERIVACLQEEYGLPVDDLRFLPLGADLRTAVYRADAGILPPYFVKLRQGALYEASVAVPRHLADLGLKQVIPPLSTRSGKLWADLPPYVVVLYPFIEGRDGFAQPLADRQRMEWGAALKQLHTTPIPATITRDIPRETFSPQWRASLTQFLVHLNGETYLDSVARELAAFLRSRRDLLTMLVARAERLARALQTHPTEFVLCHADLHAWNILIDAHGALYIVDWDTLIFAPKERDLMFVGSGLGGRGHTLQEEASLFYQGYGSTPVDAAALAYYRYDRIIEDIASYCEQIFLSSEGDADRKQALLSVQSNFSPNGTIAIACRADTMLPTVEKNAFLAQI